MNWYSRIKGSYDELHGEEQEKKYNIIKPFILKGKVLDVGCGNGKLLQKIPDSIGVEPSQDFITPGKIVCGKAEALPFKDKSFDVIISLTALHHADVKKSMAELLRVGGKQWILTILKKSSKFKKWKDAINSAFKNVQELDANQDKAFICAKPRLK